MALATKTAVEARLGRSLTSAEAGNGDARVDALLDDASAVVIGYCRTDFEPAPYPTAVVGVVAKMVARFYQRSAGGDAGFAEQQHAGPFGVRYPVATATGDVWLTAADKMALRGYRVGGGLASVQLVGERYEISSS